MNRKEALARLRAAIHAAEDADLLPWTEWTSRLLDNLKAEGLVEVDPPRVRWGVLRDKGLPSEWIAFYHDEEKAKADLWFDEEEGLVKFVEEVE